MKEQTTFEKFCNLKITESMKQFDHHIARYAVHRKCRDAMSSVYLQIYQIRVRARNGQRYQQTISRINSLIMSGST